MEGIFTALRRQRRPVLSMRRHEIFSVHLLLVIASVIVSQGAWARDIDLDAERQRLLESGYALIADNPMEIRLNGAPCGKTTSSIYFHPEADETYVVLEQEEIVLNLLGAAYTMRETAIHRADRRYQLCSFESEMSTDAGISVRGQRSADGTRFTIELTSAGAVSQSTLDNVPPLQVPELALIRWKNEGIAAGQQEHGRMFVPMTASTLPYVIRVIETGPITTPLGLVDGIKAEIEAMGALETLVLDHQAKVHYRHVAQAGMQFECYPAGANAPSAAKSGGLLHNLLESLAGGSGEPAAGMDIFRETLVALPEPLSNPRGVERMTVTLWPMPEQSLIIEDAWQTVIARGDRHAVSYQISAPQGSWPDGVPLSQLHTWNWPSEFTNLYLSPTLHVQADHPRIRQQAAALVRDAAYAGQAVAALAAWCAQTLKKSFRVTVPTAVEVLESLEGDCNEHATLYAALARSAGIPTKICVGLVYSEQFHAFGYHAWNESLVDPAADLWVAVDTTLNGAERVDATHIKLMEGDIGDWVKVVPIIGALHASVESVEP